MEPIVVNVQLTPEDYIAASRLHGRRATWVGRHGFLVGATVAVFIGTFMALGWAADSLVFPFSVVVTTAVALLVVNRVWLPYRCRKIFAQQVSLQRPYTVEFNDEGMHSRSENGTSTRPWTDLHRWAEGQDLFLIYYSDITFTMLPKRFVTDSAALRALLATRVKTAI
ncbi:MAG TPA: YcxB family protein [Gemmatimonadales bacterium]|nr:YcxB family protein [Gemmatimonadales bacterium]